jgi:hypothetical protein
MLPKPTVFKTRSLGVCGVDHVLTCTRYGAEKRTHDIALFVPRASRVLLRALRAAWRRGLLRWTVVAVGFSNNCITFVAYLDEAEAAELRERLRREAWPAAVDFDVLTVAPVEIDALRALGCGPSA